MRFRIGRLPVYMHPLLPLSWLLMSCIGTTENCLLAFICVLLHEMGHWTAAMLLKTQALSLEIMPLGGVLHLGGLYRLSSFHLLIIALAGPIVSLLLAIAAIMFPETFSLRFVLMNLLLFAFNLLPGMPMDGGRILVALLRKHLGIRRSVRIAVWIGRGIGLALAGLSIGQLFSEKRLSIPLLTMGIYLLACAGNELANCEASAAEDLSRLFNAGRFRNPQPVQALFCDNSISDDEILRTLRPDRCTLLLWNAPAKWETDQQWLQKKIHT